MNDENSRSLPIEHVHEAWPVVDKTQRLTMTVSDVAVLCWKRRYSFLVVAAIVTIMVIFAALRITPLYEASAQLEISSSMKVLDFQGGGDLPHIDYTLVNTVKERLVSTPALEQVLTDSSLSSGPAYAEGRGDPVVTLRKRIRVLTSRDSWMITVVLRDEDSQRAKQGLATLISSYYGLMHQRDVTRSSTAVDFLRTQVVESTTLYEQARQAEEGFRAANSITSADPEDNPYGRRLLELDKANIGLAAQSSALNAVVTQIAEAEVDDQLEGDRLAKLLSIDAIARHPAIGEQRQLLANAQANFALLKNQFGAKHPRMREGIEELAVRQRQLMTVATEVGVSVRASRDALITQRQGLEGRIAVEEANLAHYRADLSRMQALSQETETRGRLNEELRRRLSEQEVASRIESSQVSITSPPEVGLRPANIFPSLFLAAGLFLGSCSGIVAAFASERLDRRVRGEAALRVSSAAPVLAIIPAVKTGVPRLALAREANHPSQVEDAFETLRMSLRLTRQYRDASASALGCCLVLTATGSREGCSTVASRLAVSLAATGSKVLLVDANMRTPSLHDQFGESSVDGFSLLLAGGQANAVRTRFVHLDLFCAGQRPPHPSDLLHSPVLAWYISEARRRYDWILFDTAPVSRFSDAMVIGEHADGVILIARDGVALRDAVVDSAHKLRSLGGKLVGTVLNTAHDAKGVMGADRERLAGAGTREVSQNPLLTGVRS